MAGPAADAVFGLAGGFGATTPPCAPGLGALDSDRHADDGFTIVNDFPITRSTSTAFCTARGSATWCVRIAGCFCTRGRGRSSKATRTRNCTS